MPTDIRYATTADIDNTEERDTSTRLSRVDYVTFRSFVDWSPDEPENGDVWYQTPSPEPMPIDPTILNEPVNVYLGNEEPAEYTEDRVECIVAYAVQDFSREDIIRLYKRLKEEIENRDANIYDEVEE